MASRRPPTAEARAAEVERLAAAICGALLGTEGDAARELGAGLLRIFSLLDLAEGLRRHDARLPQTELADDWVGGGEADRRALAAAVRRECERARTASPRRGKIPPAWRAATRFLALAGGRLLREIERAGDGVLERSPRLGVGARIRLLLQARFL